MKVGKNDACPCGSGKSLKKCCNVDPTMNNSKKNNKSKVSNCVKCGRKIIIGEDVSFLSRNGDVCEECAAHELKNQISFNFE